jgi:hypothetical protein
MLAVGCVVGAAPKAPEGLTPNALVPPKTEVVEDEAAGEPNAPKPEVWAGAGVVLPNVPNAFCCWPAGRPNPLEDCEKAPRKGTTAR